MGQTSPPALGHVVVGHVVGDTVADVGCGSGVTGYLLRAAWQFTESFVREGILAPTRLVGVDWSPTTLEALARHNPYDELLLANAAMIPLGEREFETVISMENLEHLLPHEVAPAITGLARIARRRVIVSTPAPWAVTNVPFLVAELAEARADAHPMRHDEYRNLVGNLHKSNVTPVQMRAAGFDYPRNRFGVPMVSFASIVYTAAPEGVDASRLGDVVGVPWENYPRDDGREDWREAYADAVRDSLQMATPRRAPLTRRLSAVAAAVRNALNGA